MKTTLILCAMAANAFAAQPVLVRVTPETLAKLQQTDPMIRLEKPAQGEAKVARPEKPIDHQTIDDPPRRQKLDARSQRRGGLPARSHEGRG